MGFVWLVLSALVVAAGLRARARQRSALAPPPKVDDAVVRAIEEGGAIGDDAEEPLDLDQIGVEEERFWSESAWDEPEEL